MYALHGRFERIERDERDLHKGSSFADDVQLYKATCGSCGCWQQIAIRPDLLEIAAAQKKGSFDFRSGDQSFSRSQIPESILAMASVYRRKARPRRAQMTRSDV